MQLLVPIGLLALMYVFLIRPQQQRVRKARALMSALEVGDEIITIGGMVGTIVDLDEERAHVRVADGVILTFVRAAINRKVEASPTVPPEADS